MGHLKMPSEFEATVEGPEYIEFAHPNKATLQCMINLELAAVLAVMRRNVRWSGYYMIADDHDEHHLVHSLKALRKRIFSWKQPWSAIDPAEYLQPFLDIVKSDETGAPITGVALSSVYRILTLDVIDQKTVNAENAMHLVVDAVTSCRFEVTDPASEEVVLMKILQVLLACMKCKASVVLSNEHVWTIVNTCFRIVHQATTKGELLQRIARNTLHELVRCIFSHVPDVSNRDHAVNGAGNTDIHEVGKINSESASGENQSDVETNGKSHYDQLSSSSSISNMSVISVTDRKDEDIIKSGNVFSLDLPKEPYGIPCMVEVFHLLCSLLNVIEHREMGPRANSIAFDEDMPLFVLGLINSTVELAGPLLRHHPRLLNLVQDELFQNLIQLGLSMSPLIISTVCSVAQNLYHHIRTEIKLQLEAFFSCVVLRLARSRYGSTYQQQEVIMEALVDFCRQKTFMKEIYVNMDCDITCNNVFEDIVSLLYENAVPEDNPLMSMNVLALDGLLAIVKAISERLSGTSIVEQGPLNLEESTPFWIIDCQDYADPNYWVPFVRRRKQIKQRLKIGANRFNSHPKKGLEFLREEKLLTDKLDPLSVACFFRYTHGLDKNVIGDFLGNHDEFSIQILHEFAQTFDFRDMNLDTALRLFLETFRLPGESQKIQRILEAFSDRFYEQSPHIFVNKDATLLLSYSLILLNTDLHNVQVKKKMTEQDFIRNNRSINGGNDLPREYLSELYHSICKDEIRTTPDQGAGFAEMTTSRWISLLNGSKSVTPYVLAGSTAYLDRDIFSMIAEKIVTALSAIFAQAEQEDLYQTCIDGFLDVAKISSCYHLDNVLDDVIVSLGKFASLLDLSSFEEPILSDDTKAKMATVTIFTVANQYGDCIRTGWRNILGCILKLHRLGILPAHMVNHAANELDHSAETLSQKPGLSSSSRTQTSSMSSSKRSTSFISRFSQLLLLDTEEPVPQKTEQEIAAHQLALQTIQTCHIDNIFTESKFLQAESLQSLTQALIWAAGRAQTGNGSPEDEDTAVLCLDLLIALALNNRDRILLIWQSIYEHIAGIVRAVVMPCSLAEKAVFGLICICQRLVPYKENLADELLRSLQLLLRLDARVADAYCEQITQEISRLVKANATHIRSHAGWRTIVSLLAITARHPEASEAGFDALLFIMSRGAHLLPVNFLLCVDASRQFAESRVGQAEQSLLAVDLMEGSVDCLVTWSLEAKKSMGESDAAKFCEDIGEMWLRLAQGLRKVCLDQREDIRNRAIISLQKCLTVVDGIHVPHALWLQCFDSAIFMMLDDLIDITQGDSQKSYRNIEGTLILAMKLLSKVFLQLLYDLSHLTTFPNIWLAVLGRMEKCMKVKVRGKKADKLLVLVPELLRNILLVMKTRGVLVKTNVAGGDSLWEMTLLHVNKIAPFLQSEVFLDQDCEHMEQSETLREPLASDADTVVQKSQWPLNTQLGQVGTV